MPSWGNNPSLLRDPTSENSSSSKTIQHHASLRDQPNQFKRVGQRKREVTHPGQPSNKRFNAKSHSYPPWQSRTLPEPQWITKKRKKSIIWPEMQCLLLNSLGERSKMTRSSKLSRHTHHVDSLNSSHAQTITLCASKNTYRRRSRMK